MISDRIKQHPTWQAARKAEMERPGTGIFVLIAAYNAAHPEKPPKRFPLKLVGGTECEEPQAA
jgi:hypothetical protein